MYTLRNMFENATKQVLEGKWIDFSRAKWWQDILPRPDLSTLPRLPNISGLFGTRNVTLGEQELQWSLWASEFFNSNKIRLNQQLHDIERHLRDELAAWNRNHPEKNEQLDLVKMYQGWCASVEHLSLAKFSRLHIWSGTARQFLEPKFDELKNRYGMERNSKPKKEDTKVFINNDARATLIVDLTPYVDEVDLDSLSSLINGKSDRVLITANCKQSTLGKVFYEARKNGCTQASKTAFAKWICNHFQRKTDGEIYKLTFSTMQNHLKGRDFNSN